MRTKGSGSKRTIARCYALPRIMQLALNQKPHYVIEVISERLDRLSKEEQTKVVIPRAYAHPAFFRGWIQGSQSLCDNEKSREDV